MSLEYTIDSSKYDKLDESLQALYKKSDNGYQLDVKGAVSKSKVDEFRDNNTKLIKTNEDLQKQYDGFDQDGYAEWQADKLKASDDDLISKGNIDELVANKVKIVVSDFQGKLDTANERGDSYKAKYYAEVKDSKINSAAEVAMTDNKINPTFRKSLMSQINSIFTVNEGVAVAMDGDKIMTGANGNLTISEFVESQDDAFKIRSSGGNGTGGGGDGGNAPRTSGDKIKAGLQNR